MASMLRASLVRLTLSALSLVLPFTVGCEDEKEAATPEKAAASAAPVATPAPTPTPTPPEPPKPSPDCPEGSSGVGNFEAPCKGSGAQRMMEVKYTGKTEDQGPKFQVINKSKSPILYGSVAVYFYDKKGKQLEVTAGGKPRPMQLCSGNIFAGAVKPDEKIFVFFSCVKKDHVPEGTAAIEAEIKMVGFTDEEGKKSDLYWSNLDLVPDERPKGGQKAKKK
ncbi:MAG: hypothetical protein M3020_19945 [Myxococcota bacterium]|jgi:hypothetical protein|nr:hypothetical protein [Myxococcota bacterium]